MGPHVPRGRKSFATNLGGFNSHRFHFSFSEGFCKNSKQGVVVKRDHVTMALLS